MLKKPTGGKKPAAKKEKPVIVTEQIQAPYVFTKDEIADMGAEMRTHMTAMDELEAMRKQSAADFKLRIDGHANIVKQLRNKCDSGQETRPVEAIVNFNAPKREKTFIHPVTKLAIRTEPMSPADFQLPMFKPDPKTGGEAVAPKGAADVPAAGAPKPKADKKGAKKEPGDGNGKTSVGDVLDNAASVTEAPKFDLYMANIDDHVKLTREFKKAAKAAGWTEVQIGALNTQLRAVDSVPRMKEVLAPHIIDNPTEPTK